MTVGRESPYKILQLNALHNCRQHINTIRTLRFLKLIKGRF